MKKTKYKMITWEEDIYLFHLPWPEWIECHECGHRRLFWDEKGFIKLRTITKRRKKDLLDDLSEMAEGFYASEQLKWLENEALSQVKPPKVVRFRRYSKLKAKGVKLNKKGNLVRKGG